MKVSFDLNSYLLDITSDGSFPSRDAHAAQGRTPRTVALQVTRVSLDNTHSVVMQTNLEPSEARAISSALLSAATEAAKPSL